MQALALLDAILEAEWEHRYFSFNGRFQRQSHSAGARQERVRRLGLTLPPSITTDYVLSAPMGSAQCDVAAADKAGARFKFNDLRAMAATEKAKSKGVGGAAAAGAR
jgi:hypothetical protein